MKKNKQHIFEMCISINGRYMILQDNVFDLQENVNIGYLWDSLNTFKTIFNNTDIEDLEYNVVKENINKRPLLESKGNLYELRDILLEFDLLQGTWLGRQLKSSADGITDTVTQSWEGLKDFGVSIGKNSWTQILTDIAKGVRFVFRRLKDALYSNVGMVVDAVLVATVGGKAITWVPWGMVFCLEVYQISTNDYEKPMETWEKWMELIFSSLGLLASGAVAKGVRTILKPLGKSNPKQIYSAIRNNKTLMKVLTSLQGKLSSLGGYVGKLSSMFNGKFPSGVKFLSQVKGFLSNVITKFNNLLNAILGTGKISKGVKAGALTGGVLYGIDKMGNSSVSNMELSPIQTQNLETLKSLEQKYKGVDLFDI
jgi:hypothetical protein